MSTIDITPATRIRRLSDRQVTDREAIDALLDEVLIAHVAAIAGDRPVVIPMAFARDGDDILLHMSTGAGAALRAGREGGMLAMSVAEVDALVYASTLYDSSMNYRSVVVYGVPTVVPDAEKDDALRVIADKLMPGRGAEVPANSRRELAGTLVLRVPIAEAAMKRRTGEPSPAEELGAGAWTGLLPVARGWGEPVTAAETDGAPVAASVVARLA